MGRREKIDNPNIRIGEHQSIEDLTGGRIRKWHGGHPYHGGIEEESSDISRDIPDIVEEASLTRREAIDKAVEISDESFTKDTEPGGNRGELRYS